MVINGYEQETYSLKHAGDFYRKIVVLDGNQKQWVDENGFMYIGVIPFLLGNLLENIS